MYRLNEECGLCQMYFVWRLRDAGFELIIQTCTTSKPKFGGGHALMVGIAFGMSRIRCEQMTISF